MAEAELEYEMLTNPSLTFRVKLVQKPPNLPVSSDAPIYGLIWTTTPWTLPMNQAVCFRQNLEYCLIKLNDVDEYYIIAKPLIKNLEQALQGQQIFVVSELKGDQLDGCTYLNPIEKTESPFWAADHVSDDKGTGLVHTAPAHGTDDYLISLKRKMPVVNICSY